MKRAKQRIWPDSKRDRRRLRRLAKQLERSAAAANQALDAALAAVEAPKRPRYKLADLMAQCDPNAPMPDDLVAWERMPDVGKEKLE